MNYCYNCLNKLADDEQVCPRCGKEQAVYAVPPHILAPGTLINDRYLVGGILGEGGFGITYIGLDTLLDYRVAVKEFFPNGMVTRNATVSAEVVTISTERNHDFFYKSRENFLREARTLAKYTKEEGVVSVRDFFEANNTVYIVMEYLDGVTLKRYLYKKGGKMPWYSAVGLLMPVLNVLVKIHSDRLIHRDISPDNIMLVDGGVKLLDFGAAREYSDENSLSVMLKHGYAPMEQYRRHGEQGTWTDVYAFCATIYKCVTGDTPPDAPDRVFNDTLKMPSELGIPVSRTFEEVLRRGLTVKADDRIQTAGELMAGLQAALAENSAGRVRRGATAGTSDGQRVKARQAVPGQANRNTRSQSNQPEQGQANRNTRSQSNQPEQGQMNRNIRSQANQPEQGRVNRNAPGQEIPGHGGGQQRRNTAQRPDRDQSSERGVPQISFDRPAGQQNAGSGRQPSSMQAYQNGGQPAPMQAYQNGGQPAPMQAYFNGRQPEPAAAGAGGKTKSKGMNHVAIGVFAGISLVLVLIIIIVVSSKVKKEKSLEEAGAANLTVAAAADTEDSAAADNSSVIKADTAAPAAKGTYTPAEGTPLGDNLGWALNDHGVLKITGKGEMVDFDSPEQVPWHTLRNKIEYVYICNGVTSVSSYAFELCPKLRYAYLPLSVTGFGDDVFWGCITPNPYILSPNDDYALSANLSYTTAEFTSYEPFQPLGDSLVWSLTDYNVLTISGDGDMPEYDSAEQVPWHSERGKITSVKIDEGVTSVSDHAFEKCPYLKEAFVAESVTSVGEDAFTGCGQLQIRSVSQAVENYCSVHSIQCMGYIKNFMSEKNDFVTNIPCGDNITWSLNSAGELKLSGSGDMIDFDSPESVPWYSYRDMVRGVEIEEGITSISSRAFANFKNLEAAKLPVTITTIADDAFDGCEQLKIYGDGNSFDSSPVIKQYCTEHGIEYDNGYYFGIY